MKKFKKISKGMLAGMCAVLVLGNVTGCSLKTKKTEDTQTEDKLEAGETLLTINKDGTLNRKNAEDFQKSDYSIEDLKKAVDEEVEEFNEKYGSSDKAASVVSLEKEGNNAVLELKFNTSKDYKTYLAKYDDPDGKVVFFTGTGEEAQKYKLPEEVNPVGEKDSQSSNKTSDILKDGDIKVVITNRSEQMKIDGDVKYVSEDAKCEDGIVTGKSGTNTYIFYK